MQQDVIETNCFSELTDEFTDNYLYSLNPALKPILPKLKNKCLNQPYDNHYQFLTTVVKDDVASVVRLGDMHNGGKCTLLVKTSDSQYIYKPLNIDLLIILNEVLALLNQSRDFNFYQLKVIENTRSHAKIEYLNNEAPQDDKKYAYHYGALIAVITLLRGVDFHYENIFCINSTPVVIDCESLFYPIIKETKAYDVTATSMLPTVYNQQSTLNHITLSVVGIINGIRAVCNVLSQHRDTVHHIINSGSKKTSRLILKPTRFYYDVLKRSMHPQFLLQPDKRKKYIQQCLVGNHVISKVIAADECQDLMQFDIPYFTYQQDELRSSRGHLLIQDFCLDAVNEMQSNLSDLKSFENQLIRKVVENGQSQPQL